MLERVKEILAQQKNKVDFFSIVGRYFPLASVDYTLIYKSYETAKRAFDGKYRESGERYFEHLRGVAVILMVYLRCRDANMIAAALLHDIIEDIEGWDQQKILIEFNVEVSQIVWYVTMEDLEVYSGDEEARNIEYHKKLYSAPRKAIVLKLCDRLHNVLTLWATDEEKQLRKVRETQDFYLPLAEREMVFIHELECALAEVRAGWNVIKN